MTGTAKALSRSIVLEGTGHYDRPSFAQGSRAAQRVGSTNTSDGCVACLADYGWDLHYNAPNVRQVCERTGRELVTTQYGPPHTDIGVEVRRVFHELRSRAIENFNGQFKGIFDALGQVPTKGLVNTKRFALGAIFVYQLVLLYRFEHRMHLRVGLKPFLKAA